MPGRLRRHLADARTLRFPTLLGCYRPRQPMSRRTLGHTCPNSKPSSTVRMARSSLPLAHRSASSCVAKKWTWVQKALHMASTEAISSRLESTRTKESTALAGLTSSTRSGLTCSRIGQCVTGEGDSMVAVCCSRAGRKRVSRDQYLLRNKLQRCWTFV